MPVRAPLLRGGGVERARRGGARGPRAAAGHRDRARRGAATWTSRSRRSCSRHQPLAAPRVREFEGTIVLGVALAARRRASPRRAAPPPNGPPLLGDSRALNADDQVEAAEPLRAAAAARRRARPRASACWAPCSPSCTSAALAAVMRHRSTATPSRRAASSRRARPSGCGAPPTTRRCMVRRDRRGRGVTSARLAGREHQVVEARRGQVRLQHGGVHLLQRDVAVVGVLEPGARDLLEARRSPRRCG